MATVHKTWDELDRETREELEAQYLRELGILGEPGLTDEGREAYLRYRHERPARAVTTYEEGQLHKMLHRLTDPAALPDPVDQESHRGRLENFGARRLHWTNTQTYVAVMVTLTFAFVLALFVLVAFI